jgi:hypothetical protein
MIFVEEDWSIFHLSNWSDRIGYRKNSDTKVVASEMEQIQFANNI